MGDKGKWVFKWQWLEAIAHRKERERHDEISLKACGAAKSVARVIAAFIVNIMYVCQYNRAALLMWHVFQASFEREYQSAR